MKNLVAHIRDEQRRQWQSGCGLLLEHFLQQHPELRQVEESTLNLIVAEKQLREEFGEQVPPNDYLHRFPHLAEKLAASGTARLADAASEVDTARVSCQGRRVEVVLQRGAVLSVNARSKGDPYD